MTSHNHTLPTVMSQKRHATYNGKRDTHTQYLQWQRVTDTTHAVLLKTARNPFVAMIQSIKQYLNLRKNKVICRSYVFKKKKRKECLTIMINALGTNVTEGWVGGENGLGSQHWQPGSEGLTLLKQSICSVRLYFLFLLMLPPASLAAMCRYHANGPHVATDSPWQLKACWHEEEEKVRPDFSPLSLGLWGEMGWNDYIKKPQRIQS